MSIRLRSEALEYLVRVEERRAGGTPAVQGTANVFRNGGQQPNDERKRRFRCILLKI
jgi:hypothetical protein